MLEELTEELTQRLLEVQTESNIKVYNLSVKASEHQALEAHYKAEAARFIMLQSENMFKGQQRMTAQAGSIIRPSTSMPVMVTYDGEDWHCENGDVDGLGVTPETACQEFDRQWLGKDEV